MDYITYPLCRNRNCKGVCHPYHAKKYDGYCCLNCANAGVPDLEGDLADVRAKLAALWMAANDAANLLNNLSLTSPMVDVLNRLRDELDRSESL